MALVSSELRTRVHLLEDVLGLVGTGPRGEVEALGYLGGMSVVGVNNDAGAHLALKSKGVFCGAAHFNRSVCSGSWDVLRPRIDGALATLKPEGILGTNTDLGRDCVGACTRVILRVSIRHVSSFGGSHAPTRTAFISVLLLRLVVAARTRVGQRGRFSFI